MTNKTPSSMARRLYQKMIVQSASMNDITQSRAWFDKLSNGERERIKTLLNSMPISQNNAAGIAKYWLLEVKK